MQEQRFLRISMSDSYKGNNSKRKRLQKKEEQDFQYQKSHGDEPRE